MDVPRQQVIQMLRRAGLEAVAEAAQKALPDPVDSKALEHFFASYGLSKQSLSARMGGSP